MLVYSGENDRHFDQVEETIFRLHKAGLQGDIKKSSFDVTVIDYLGVILEAGKGVRVDPAKVEAILGWKFEDLRNLKAVRSFLGLCTYIRMFCHHASNSAELLTSLLKKDALFIIDKKQQQAFKELKKLAT